MSDKLSAGVDVGALWTKAAVMSGGELLGWHVEPTAEDSGASAEAALGAALHMARASRGDVGVVVATGAGRDEVRFAAEQATDVLCIARGCSLMDAEACGVVEMGAEATRVIRLDGARQVDEYALNDKCAAGTGVFLDAMAKAMGVELEAMGPLSLEAKGDVSITSMCVVFAESEVVSQVHRQTPKEDILRGMHRSIATRVHGLVNRVGLDGRVMAAGGLAHNVGIVACLEELMGSPLAVPEHPQLVAALGAASIAAERMASR